MSPRVIHHRQVICRTCPAPCQLYVDDKIDPANPSFACGARRFAAYYGDGLTIPQPAPIVPLGTYNGALKWAQLHLQAFGDRITGDWLAAWSQDLPPCCRPHWLADLQANPLPPTNQFSWTVDRHNAVSTRLNRPRMTLAQALHRWSQAA